MSRNDRDLYYTPMQVEKIAKNYVYIKSALYGSTKVPMDREIFINTPSRDDGFEKPLGWQRGTGWPMSEPKHARPVIDGKTKAQNQLELHAATMDFEIAMSRMNEKDADLIIKYHVLGTHTLEELCAERGITSKGSMSDLLTRVIKRLTRVMNNEQPSP